MDRIIPQHRESLAGLGQFVHNRRRRLGLTQTGLAGRLDWTQERISLVERAKYGLPSLPNLAMLADALECRLSEVLAASGYSDSTLGGITEGIGDGANAVALLYALDRLLHNNATSLADALNNAADILAEVLSAEKFDAFILDPESPELVALGTSDTPLGRREKELGLDRLPIANAGREVEVFTSGKTFHTGDARNDPDMLRPIIDGLGVQSVILVPLSVGDERRGLLAATDSRPDFFSAADLAFLEGVSRAVGLTAGHAELEAQVTLLTHQSRQDAGGVSGLTSVLA